MLYVHPAQARIIRMMPEFKSFAFYSTDREPVWGEIGMIGDTIIVETLYKELIEGRSLTEGQVLLEKLRQGLITKEEFWKTVEELRNKGAEIRL